MQLHGFNLVIQFLNSLSTMKNYTVSSKVQQTKLHHVLKFSALMEI